MRITDLQPDDEQIIRQAAALLVAGFQDAWPTLELALAEVRACLQPERFGRVAIGNARRVLGWVGAMPHYDGRVWEVHPLVVAPAFQRQGIGRRLVADVEARARERGGLTLWAGADDQDGRTSLSGVDLYEDLPRRLASVENLGGHPYESYQRLGFTIVGVMPDASGFGKPDIYLAKRIMTESSVSQLASTSSVGDQQV